MKKQLLLTSQLLLTIICLVHLFVMLTYALGNSPNAYIFPSALLITILLHTACRNWLGINKDELRIASVVVLTMLIFSLGFGWFYFDFSWDGQWYHQAAVYHLEDGWNPFISPTELPKGDTHTSILHFPKSCWYFGTSLLRLFGTVELGKSFNVIVLVAAFGVVYTFFQNQSLSRNRSFILTLLALLNPVVWSELTTYLNDGNLYLLILIYVTSTVSWIQKPQKMHLLIAAMATCCLVNSKFTGLVFFLIISFILLIYLTLRNREKIKSFLITHLFIAFIAIFIFGFNPYVTNWSHRGHPLYPIMGTEAHPSVFADGEDANEEYETPQNMKGKNLAIRLFYATFSQPGNAPYNDETEALLVNPFRIDTRTWGAYQYHETRLAGFGPYFGLLLIFALITVPFIAFRNNSSLLPLLLFSIAIIVCLSLSKYFWWPRFFPMLWLVPITILFIYWKQNDGSLTKRNMYLKRIHCWLLTLLIGLNGLVVAVVHMTWETKNSIELRRILVEIRDTKQPIEVHYGWFKRSVEEKLSRWNIKFSPKSLKGEDAKGTYKMPSVVKGYPNQVLYRKK